MKRELTEGPPTRMHDRTMLTKARMAAERCARLGAERLARLHVETRLTLRLKTVYRAGSYRKIAAALESPCNQRRPRRSASRRIAATRPTAVRNFAS